MTAGISHGFGAPFIRVFYGNIEITDIFESFKYENSEESDEVCTMEIKSDNPFIADEPYFKDKAELKLIWGFIAGMVSSKAKVYVQDTNWKYDKDNNVSGTIVCTDKAVSLKFSDSREVHTDSNLLGMANKLATRNGVKAYLELPEDKEAGKDFLLSSNGGLETVERYLIRNNNYKAQEVQKQLSKKSPAQAKMDLEKFFKKVQADNSSSDKNILNFFKNYKNVPQANKTDKQLLDELGRREKNGPYIMQTQDDELIIRKRNFNQPPYRSYVYGEGTSEMLDFKPQTRNYSTRHNSVNQSFGGWNAADKSFFSGNANAETMSDNPTLNKFMEMAKFYRGLKSKGLGDLIAGSRNKNRNIFIGKSNIAAHSDNSLVYTKGNIYVPITVTDKLNAIEKSIQAYNDLATQYNKNVYDSLGINPQDSFYNANNNRQLSQLKNNPATATVYGDPNLRVGIIITILSVSKRHSGNYYIIKCVHTIDKNSGYVCDLEMVRHGANSKVGDNYEESKSLGKVVNDKVGPDSTINKKTVKVTGNPIN